MADAQESQLVKPKFKYFRSKIARLSIQYSKKPEKGQIAPQVETFVPYSERYQGDQISVGYLKTKNEIVIKACEEDPNVESISQEEYTKATSPKEEKASV